MLMFGVYCYARAQEKPKDQECERKGNNKWKASLAIAKIPILNKRFLGAPGPEEEGRVSSISNNSWLAGAFEGVSVSPADIFTLFDGSVVTGTCLEQVQDLSALVPSFKSSASLEDKPCKLTIDDYWSS